MTVIRTNSSAVRTAARRQVAGITLTLVLLPASNGCGAAPTRVAAPAPAQEEAAQDKNQKPSRIESDAEFEAAQTEKLLGVPVPDFPPPQGLTGFDDLPADAPEFKFTVTERPPSGAPVKEYYEDRPWVQARAPDGSVYEAYLGHDDPEQIVPGHGFVSTMENRRQWYGTHHGYGYSPEDVFIGKREADGRLRPTLFFRDVGSHATAPHHIAVDSRGMVHLAVADVNIYQDNRLDLYWAIGDPASGKWTSAWHVARRGFTSWSHPWNAAWGDKVHLLWNWCDVSINKNAPGMGMYHVEWSPAGFGRQLRVIPVVVTEWGAALDSQSGRILIAFSKEDGVYVISRSEGGGWTHAARLHPRLRERADIAVEAAADGTFIVKTRAATTRAWVLRPL